jgi:hypothetical protein
MKATWILSAVLVGTLGTAAAAEDKVQLICDFETDADAKLFEAPGKLVAQGVTHGKKAMEVTGALKMVQPPSDWSAYDALQLDVFVPGQTPVEAEVMICDKAWQAKVNYWNRHNGPATFGPGQNTWTIPVRGMYRGEAGSRNNDIKRDIDPDSITVLLFSFKGTVVVDNLRLVKAERPKGVWAFDFGPASQAVQLGWTAVSNKAKYDAKAGHGLGFVVGDSAARDSTFGPPLLRDFVELGGNTFRVDVPEGKYAVTVYYENSGYWDGEQAQQKTRTIEVDGKQVWKDERADGSAHSLWRFENVEPIGVDIWDTYMAAELAKPAVFEAEAGKEGLTLKFAADADWGSRIAGIALYKADDAGAAAWLKDQIERLANDFRRAAVCLDPPAQKVEMPAAGFLAWPVDIGDTVKPASLPAKMPAGTGTFEISRMAVQGEYEPFCVAIRPGKDLGACQLRLEGGRQDVQATIGVVWYGLNRTFGTVAYHVAPHTLRTQSVVALPKDVTREIVVTCRVADDAKAGDVAMTLVVEDAGKAALLRVPLKLSVHAVKLDRQSDYCMGYFGMNPPGALPAEQRTAAMEDTLNVLKEHGMNALSAGAGFQFKGFTDGRPEIDFAAMDTFLALVRKHGFTKGLLCYGGGHLSGVSDGYQVGATGRKVAQQAGVPYDQALLKIFKVVDEHARAADWPLLYYCICDETRVPENAQRELEFMDAMAKVTKEYPKTLRTSGAYGVNFNKRPENKNDMLYWHQRFFGALDISALGEHDESVMAEAAKLGKEVHIYNQGQGRYSFGLYQWNEYRKGIKARWEWHLSIMHGYQFFDLDGREPDSQLICYGRKGIIPTLQIERCREGAEDFYLYNTLWRLIEKGAGSEESRTAGKALLEDVVGKMKVAQRQPPAGFDAEAFKAKVVAAIESLK